MLDRAPRLRVITRYFDDRNAILYAPDDVDAMARRIREVYERRERLDEMRGALREFNVRHNWPDMADRYLTLVEELTREGPDGAPRQPPVRPTEPSPLAGGAA